MNHTIVHAAHDAGDEAWERDYSLGLDWSGAGAPSDPIAYLHRIVEQSDRRWANARMVEPSGGSGARWRHFPHCSSCHSRGR